MSIFIKVARVVCALGFVGMSASSEPDRALASSIHAQGALPGHVQLLPDLQTRQPFDLTVVAESGKRTLRLSNTIWNRGAGLFELHGQPDLIVGVMRVVQRIYRTDGSFWERPIPGDFIYHKEHDHWHFTGVAEYELFNVQTNGHLGGRVATGGKVSFCLRNDVRDSSYPVKTKFSRSGACNPGAQAIAPGWGDIYKSDLPDQTIDITRVPDGLYVLRSTTDPDNLFLETDESNNVATVIVRLAEDCIAVAPDLSACD